VLLNLAADVLACGVPQRLADLLAQGSVTQLSSDVCACCAAQLGADLSAD